MQDSVLFLSLAEIAGVFVGFGALIAVRSGARTRASEINGIRWVVTIAIWVVVAALAPVIISAYGVAGHQLWLVASLLALALFVVMIAVFLRTPENVAVMVDNLENVPPALTAFVMVPTVWLPVGVLVLALSTVVLGLLPEHDHALYLTAIGLAVLIGALGLFVAVFWQPRPGADGIAGR